MTREFDIKKAMIWAKTWPNIKILNDKDIKELLAYENTSLWWFIDQALIYRLIQSLNKGVTQTRSKLLISALVKLYLAGKYLLRSLYGKRMLLDRTDYNTSKTKILLITQSLNWGTTYKGRIRKRVDRQFDEVIEKVPSQS